MIHAGGVTDVTMLLQTEAGQQSIVSAFEEVYLKAATGRLQTTNISDTVGADETDLPARFTSNKSASGEGGKGRDSGKY